MADSSSKFPSALNTWEISHTAGPVVLVLLGQAANVYVRPITMTVLVKGTNEWVCTPGNENKIGDPTYVHESYGYAMDDGCQATKAEADEHSARNDLHAVRRHAEKQYRSFG